MTDDSGDSDIDPRPSCSQNRRSTRGNTNHGGGNCTESRKGKKRRIVMRIEFDDSGEDSSSASEVSGEDGQAVSGNNKAIPRRTRQNSRAIGVKIPTKNKESDDSEDIHRNNSQRLRNRRTNIILDGSDSDGSSSGSEINRSVKTRVTKSSKKIIISEDEQMHSSNEVDKDSKKQTEVATEAGFNSDSSSNELLEKCPICLLTFRQQEIGSPVTCAHNFCASCIEAWSKNVQTCPIDRIEFDRIIVRDNFENRRIVREINVDPNKISKELVLDDEADGDDEDVTYCEVCNSPEREDVMLLCDECNQGYHMDCLTPRLTQIPEGSWYCDNCFDPMTDSDNVSEDLNMLYEDIRDMGIPQAALRVTELQQPRILRTRQNERIRAAVLRTTRSRARIETTTTTTTSAGTGRGRGRPRNSTTTTTTTTTTRTTRPSTIRRKPSRRRRRRTRKRTYVVEYDLNNFDEKFAIKTTKKIIRRRRRKRRASARNSGRTNTGERMTASKRLAEQMGVKKDPTYTSHLSGTSAGLSLFGGANDLEYFSDSDNGGIEHEIQVETGHGTALQTSIRISNFGSQRARKGILLGRLQGNNRSSVLPDLPPQTAAPTSGDLLSSIMDMQDRWHNAARHMENVHISADGTLQLPSGGISNSNAIESNSSSANGDSNPGQTSRNPVSANEQQSHSPINPLEGVTQAPMYPRGGGNQNFGGGGGGNYNNRYSNNQNNYRGSGGGGQYRHSMGGSGGGDGNDGGRGNFNFNNQNLSNSNNSNQNQNFSPFSMRFNQRNNQRNNNQRNSLPFMHRNDDDRQQQQNQLQNTPNEGNNPFRNRLPPSQQQNISNENPLFGDLPPPVRGAPPPVVGPAPLMSAGPLGMSGPPPVSGLPSMAGPPPIMGPLSMTGPPPQAISMSGPPPPLAMHSPLQTMRPLMSVPPPPAPPPGVPMPWGTPLFQQLNNDYGNDDDDSNCPNCSVYSAESQEVAKSTEMHSQTQQDNEAAKEDDENEDLVQLDDDDEIPMPPETNPNESTTVKDSDLYEPENPTEENEDDDNDDDGTNEELKNTENSEINENDGIEKADRHDQNVEEIASPRPSQPDSTDHGDSQYDPEHEIISNEGSNMAVDNKKENSVDCSKSNNEPIDMEQKAGERQCSHSRTPSPTPSETKLPESDVGIANKKGVLELYDDSDWEELDIDKPKEYEKAAKVSDKSDIEDGPYEGEEDKVKERSKRNKSKGKEIDDKNEGDLDRSYTPCLDENNDPEESQENGQIDEVGTKSLNNSKDSNAQTAEGGKTPEVVASATANIETELISDDEDNARGSKKRRNSKKRDKRDKKVETFKKVSNKQKVRNYRTDKQQVGKYKDRHHSSRSRSRTRSISRSRSRTRSRSRIRSHSRSPRTAVSRSRSPHSGRSRSRSPRGRGRRRSRSRSLRSRSRSNNKENNWRQGSRYNNSQNKFQDRNKQQNQYRPKRREIPRYNVRNVVGIQRTFREGREVRDRYGRDTSRQLRNVSRSPSPRTRRLSGRSISRSRSRGRSVSPRRNRRGSFSISPSPQQMMRRQSTSPRQRYRSPRRNSFSPRRITPMRAHSRSPLRMRSRSLTPQRMGGRKVIRRVRDGSPLAQSAISRSPSPLHSLSASPRYTPRLHRSHSKTPSLRAIKGKKKKIKDKGKKKKKKRLPSISPETNLRISRQRDAFEVDRPPKKKRHHSPKQKSSLDEPTWSPSPSPAPLLDYERDNNVSWTPPLVSPRLVHEMHGIYEPEEHRSNSRSSKRDKRTKRIKKKKKGEKRREVRKDKRRTRRTQTPEPVPSKEVFASGNNILVSVSFNKDGVGNQPPSQTTVVTLPATREDLHTIRRNSIDCLTNSNAASKKKKKRKKLDAKPVAIIDLERSPFQVHQEPADVIVLTDSEEGVGGRDSEHEHGHEHEHDRRRENHRERRRSQSIAEDMEHHRSQMSNGIRTSSQLDKTPPLERERLDTILEESYDLPQTGPKTPPEPPTVKFNIASKKQTKVRNNPLHDEAELNSESEMAEVREPDTHRSELEQMHVQSSQKIGPNTPPESGPCSPDAYDPFDPTKSPSMSPRSPSPAPLNSSQASIGMDSSVEVVSSQKHLADERLTNERTASQISGASGGMTAQGSTLNPVELVMKLMNTKQNSSQDLNKSNDSQYNTATHMHGTGMGNPHDDKIDEAMGLTVISNVLLSNGSAQGGSQHIPVISSPTPMIKSNQISKLPLPKVGSSVGSSSGAGMTSSNSNARNGGLDEPVNLTEMESPYSPGSADYEDLFEPPPDSSGAVPRRSKRGANNANAMGKVDVFDNLFGSTSPVGHARVPKKFKAIVTSSTKKAKIKVTKTDDHVKVYDDVPNSAVELQVKDKFLRKLNRQERVVEEVKLVLKPRFNKKQITKDDYKEIMRRAVPKICHSRSGEINPHKIKNLIDAYVRKFRAKHKKLNLLNTGQVSSAVKCAAYLKKL
ncbi:protein split ends [Zeugodacus cucurbitae]|uniref:protein split ends n=1 Tax=Zeugodacus cucurbitae TaxID=28588 RepID=UPI0005968B63|nr:protein split ends [Zeugodacus cucurbitae]